MKRFRPSAAASSSLAEIIAGRQVRHIGIADDGDVLLILRISKPTRLRAWSAIKRAGSSLDQILEHNAKVVQRSPRKTRR